MALTAKIAAKIVANYSNALDLTTVLDNLSDNNEISLTSGTGANQADLIFHDRRTLSASATEDLDLAGSLSDAFGATLTFARIKAMMVFAAAANTNNVLVKAAAANGFVNWVSAAGDEIVVRPGGVFLLAAPDATAYAVTAGTGDLLTITNSAGGTSVTYDIVLIGASA